MTQRSFIAKREEDWKELEQLITGKGIKRGIFAGKKIREKASWFPQAFRQLTGDLNTARSNGFDPALIERLNRLTLEGNQILYGSKPFSIRLFSEFIFRTFPRSVRTQWKSFGACCLIFFGRAAFICRGVCVL